MSKFKPERVEKNSSTVCRSSGRNRTYTLLRCQCTPEQQLLLKTLNTPADLLSQLYANRSNSTILIACKCAKTLEDASQNF